MASSLTSKSDVIEEDHHAYNWTVSEVEDWLLDKRFKCKFDEFISIFRQHEIDGEALLSLNDSKLMEMGINIIGRRTKLNNAIKKLKYQTDINISKTFQSQNKNKSNDDNKYNEQNLHLIKAIDPASYFIKKRKAISSAGGTQPNSIYSSGILREKRKTADLMIRSIANSKINSNVPRSSSLQHVNTNSNRLKYNENIPNFNNIKNENAVKYSWDIKQNKWIRSSITIKMAPNPFENGSLRIAWYCIEVRNSKSVPSYNDHDIDNKLDIKDNNHNMHQRHQSFDIRGNPKIIQNKKAHINSDKIINRLYGYEHIYGGTLCVIKKGNPMIDSQPDSLSIYFNDVQAQIESKRFADEYNKYNPPKKITFLNCCVVQLIDRVATSFDHELYDINYDLNAIPIHQFYCLEPYLFGRYCKHSNNMGWDENKRNTPSAFTHFTLNISSNRLCVCDIQGVNDLYTDPQIHTYNGYGFGAGNRGKEGIDKFIKKHKCNAICSHFKLSKYNKQIIKFNGNHKTMPHTRFIKQVNIKKLNTDYIDDNHHFDIPYDIIYQPLQVFPPIVTKKIPISIPSNSNINVKNEFKNINDIKSPLLNGNQNSVQNNNNDNNNENNDDDTECCVCSCLIL